MEGMGSGRASPESASEAEFATPTGSTHAPTTSEDGLLEDLFLSPLAPLGTTTGTGTITTTTTTPGSGEVATTPTNSGGGSMQTLALGEAVGFGRRVSSPLLVEEVTKLRSEEEHTLQEISTLTERISSQKQILGLQASLSGMEKSQREAADAAAEKQSELQARMEAMAADMERLRAERDAAERRALSVRAGGAATAVPTPVPAPRSAPATAAVAAEASAMEGLLLENKALRREMERLAPVGGAAVSADPAHLARLRSQVEALDANRASALYHAEARFRAQLQASEAAHKAEVYALRLELAELRTSGPTPAPAPASVSAGPGDDAASGRGDQVEQATARLQEDNRGLVAQLGEEQSRVQQLEEELQRSNVALSEAGLIISRYEKEHTEYDQAIGDLMDITRSKLALTRQDSPYRIPRSAGRGHSFPLPSSPHISRQPALTKPLSAPRTGGRMRAESPAIEIDIRPQSPALGVMASNAWYGSPMGPYGDVAFF